MINLTEYYRTAEVATPTQWFHLYGKLDRYNYWELMEHSDRNWLGVFEIASAYNKDAEEVFYYVGGIDAEPIAPSYEEIHHIIKYRRERGMRLTAYESLMIDILFGV
jgi:hypothetical protein